MPKIKTPGATVNKVNATKFYTVGLDTTGTVISCIANRISLAVDTTNSTIYAEQSISPIVLPLASIPNTVQTAMNQCEAAVDALDA